MSYCLFFARIAESSIGKTIGITLGSMSVLLVIIVAMLCHKRKLDRKRQRTTKRKKWSVKCVVSDYKMLNQAIVDDDPAGRGWINNGISFEKTN